MREYWITWGYTGRLQGHVSHSDKYSSYDSMKRVLKDSSLWPSGCFPSSIFETINGEVI